MGGRFRSGAPTGRRQDGGTGRGSGSGSELATRWPRWQAWRWEQKCKVRPEIRSRWAELARFNSDVSATWWIWRRAAALIGPTSSPLPANGWPPPLAGITLINGPASAPATPVQWRASWPLEPGGRICFHFRSAWAKRADRRRGSQGERHSYANGPDKRAASSAKLGRL